MGTSTLSQVLDYWRSSASSTYLPRWRQLLEMCLLYGLRRIGPGYYVQARWGRTAIPLRDKWEHMNRAEYQRFIATWNPRPYQKSSQHKLIEKATVSLQNLPTPRFVGYVHPRRGRTANGDPLRTASDLEALLACHVGKRLCFKRPEGFGGYGFQSYAIGEAPSGIVLRGANQDAPSNPAHWWQLYGTDKEGFLIEEYLDQHTLVSSINRGSVNTVRLWVILTDEECDVVGGYLRVGRGTSEVDNISSGGLVGILDVKSGRVTSLVDPMDAMAALPRHPDSDVDLRGFQLPYWEKVKELACEAILAFPRIQVVGLDIAFGQDGPVLIELNVCPDYIGCAWMDMPLKQLDRRMRSGSREIPVPMD